MKTLFAVLLLSAAAWCQNTTVSGTIIDPNGNVYANGNVSALTVANTGQSTQTFTPTTLDGNGFFSRSLPSSLTYVFTLCATPVQLGPLGNLTPKQVCFNTAPIFVNGPTQDISALANPSAAVLGPAGSSLATSTAGAFAYFPVTGNRIAGDTNATDVNGTGAVNFATSVSVGSGVNDPGTNGDLALPEQSGAPTGQNAVDILHADNGTHNFLCNLNNGGLGECFQKTFNLIQAGTNTNALTIGSGGSLTFASGSTLKLSALTGTQCLHAITGVVSGTGVDCGSGGGSGGLLFVNVAQTGNYTVQVADFSTATTYPNAEVLTGSSAFTFTLPATAPTANGAVVGIRNESTAILTLAPGAGRTIDGSSNNILLAPGKALAIMGDGTNYHRVLNTLTNPSDIGPALYAADTGAADAYVVNPPIIPALGLTDGLEIFFLPSAANATTTPTVNYSALGAKTITRFGEAAVVANDISSSVVAHLIYRSSTGHFQLLNPQIIPVANGGTGLTTGTANGLPCFATTTSMTSTVALVANSILIGVASTCANTASGEQIKTNIFSNTQAGNPTEYAGGADTAGSSTFESAGWFRGGAYTGTGTGATAVGGSAWLYGGPNNANNATTYAGTAGMFAGQSTNGTAPGHQGTHVGGAAYLKGTTVTQWNLQQLASAEKTQDAAATPTSILGVAYNVQAGATSSVWVADLGEVPINASAAVTAGDTVCAGATAGQVTDSGGTGPCVNAITVGHVTRVSGTVRVLTPFASNSSNDSTVALSTTLPLVRLEFSTPQDYFQTQTHCSSSASPAVCGANKTGFVTVAAGASTIVVNTTNVTANSTILVTEDQSLGTALGVTCNTTFIGLAVTARTAGTSFTIGSSAAPVTNPLCVSYQITN